MAFHPSMRQIFRSVYDAAKKALKTTDVYLDTLSVNNPIYASVKIPFVPCDA